MRRDERLPPLAEMLVRDAAAFALVELVHHCLHVLTGRCDAMARRAHGGLLMHARLRGGGGEKRVYSVTRGE